MVKTLTNSIPAPAEDEDFYEVEKILEKRKKGKRTTYLVKWLGYSENENTWEPISNLRNVKNMVQEFENQSSECFKQDTKDTKLKEFTNLGGFNSGGTTLCSNSSFSL